MEQDTGPEGLRRYHEKLQALTPAERARITAGLTAGVRRAARAGLRLRHPAASEEELEVRLAVRLYGRAIAQRVYRDIPDDAV